MSTRSGPGRPGARSGQFLLRILSAGAPEVAPAGLVPEWSDSITNLISRSTTSGPGRPGAQNGQFLIRILLAGAPEVVPTGLGLGMVSFYYESD